MKTLKWVQKILPAVVVLIFGATALAYAQVVLPEIVVRAANYNYLNAVGPEEASQPVDMVEQAAAAYDIKWQEFYEDEYDKYFVSFIIPEGKILAAYAMIKWQTSAHRRKIQIGCFTLIDKESSGRQISRLGHFQRCISGQL